MKAPLGLGAQTGVQAPVHVLTANSLFRLLRSRFSSDIRSSQNRASGSKVDRLVLISLEVQDRREWWNLTPKPRI